jgi:hypothetical protein
MKLKYFIDYRFEEKVQQFVQIGIWIQDQDDLGIDIYYPDETSDVYWEAIWVMNRLVENNLNAPADFLEHHQARAGHLGMRSRVFKEETKLGVDEFMRRTLKKSRDGMG